MSLILPMTVILLLAYQIYLYVTGKPGKSPPGLPRLPIWGSYWFLLWGDYKFPYKTIMHYVKKYKSKIISLYLGTGPYGYTIVVNDYQGIKEVLSRQEFDGRLGGSYVTRARAFGKQLGIFFNDDTEWLIQRRFALRTMRDFGFGRRHEKLECFIASQVAVLMDTLKNGAYDKLEKTVAMENLAYFPDVLFPSCANPIWFVMTGEKYEREDHEMLRKLCRSAMSFQRNGDTTGGAISQTPWLRFFGNGFGFKGFVGETYAIADFARAFITERKASSHGKDGAKGFIDMYLQRLKDGELTRGFSEEQLLIVVVDLMFPALSAVPSVLTHIIKLTMHHPEVMKKVQREIDYVVGRTRLPGWNDRINKNFRYEVAITMQRIKTYGSECTVARKNDAEMRNLPHSLHINLAHKLISSILPYTEATIREAMRIETITPFSVAHRAIKRTTLGGYDVPINTTVITNLAGMHKDPELWGDPDNFRPERFLTQDGQRLDKDFSLPFGFGRRVCAGETFGRFIIFAHFAALAQNFCFDFVEGQPTKLDDVLPGLITTPKETWIRVSPR